MNPINFPENLWHYDHNLINEMKSLVHEFIQFTLNNNNNFLQLDVFYKQWIIAVKNLFNQFKNLDNSTKKFVASNLTQAKNIIDNYYEQEKNHYKNQLILQEDNQSFNKFINQLDPPQGTLHPIQWTIIELTNIMNNLGFTLRIDDILTTEEDNFDHLNVPINHPARDVQDTFFLNNNYILRTHTSTSQIRALKTINPPIKIFSIGKVFRNETIDATHNSMFYQMELMYINNDANCLSLRGTIEEILKDFFKDNSIKIRFRSSFFPFTTPSFEIDMYFNHQWLEVGGCGMIHPNVLNHCINNENKYQGFAAGFGVDRLHMIKNNTYDIRNLYIHQTHCFNNYHNTNNLLDIQ